MHLAQINIATLLAPIDDPKIREFRDNLESINALAEKSPGFVWRLRDESNNATAINTPFGPEVIANMSVWRDLESLRLYVYKSAHAPFIRRRGAWFHDHSGAHLALWWIPSGHFPDLHEARNRLRQLAAHGPTPQAFTFSRSFDPHGAPTDRHGQHKHGTIEAPRA